MYALSTVCGPYYWVCFLQLCSHGSNLYIILHVSCVIQIGRWSVPGNISKHLHCDEKHYARQPQTGESPGKWVWEQRFDAKLNICISNLSCACGSCFFFNYSYFSCSYITITVSSLIHLYYSLPLFYQLMLSLLLDVCLFLGTLRALLLQAWMRHESGYGCLIFFYGCAWDTEQCSSWCPKSWNRQDDILRLLWSRTECVSLWEMLGHWGLASYCETLNKNKPISVMNNEITSTLQTHFFAACFSGLTLYCLSLGCLAAMSLNSVSYVYFFFSF